MPESKKETGRQSELNLDTVDVVCDAVDFLHETILPKKIPGLSNITTFVSTAADVCRDTSSHSKFEKTICNGAANIAKGAVQLGPSVITFTKTSAVLGPRVGLSAAGVVHTIMDKPAQAAGELTRSACYATVDWSSRAYNQLRETRALHHATNYSAPSEGFRQQITGTNFFSHASDIRPWSFDLSLKPDQQNGLQLSSSSSIYGDALKQHLSTSLQFNGAADFAQTLMATQLTSSYGTYNDKAHKIYPQEGPHQDIGGVAGQAGLITSLINSPAHAFADHFYLCFPKEGFTIRQDYFQRIQYEIQEAYFKHRTLPFFSLHFNQSGFLYPVIHPAFQNTLTGEVIALLDYWMKGFLNGGVFDEEFLKQWHLSANTDETVLRSKMISLKKYCKEKLGSSFNYFSLRELENRYGIKIKHEDSAYQQPFMTSFRIIAHQEKIEAHENIILPHPDFKVEYSIDMMPDYKQHVESYLLEHGKYPEEYEKTLTVYELLAEEIKEKMPKLPFCKEFFSLLGIINSLCYFYVTLEKMGKRPLLSTPPEPLTHHVPKAFPHIPIQYYKTYPVRLELQEVIKSLQKTHGESALEKEFAEIFTSKNPQQLPSSLIIKIQQAISVLVQEKINPYLLENESSEINEDEIERFTQKMTHILLLQLQFIHTSIKKQISQTALLLPQEDCTLLLASIKEKPLAERIQAIKEAYLSRQHFIQEQWKLKPNATLEELLTLLPMSKKDQADILKQFESIQKKDIEEKEKATEEFNASEQKKLEDFIQARTVHWQKEIASTQSEQEKQIAQIVSSRIQEKEAQLNQQASAEIKIGHDAIAQLNARIKEEETHTAQQIATFPLHLRNLNRLQILTFTQKQDALIRSIKDAIQEIQGSIQSIEQERTTKIALSRLSIRCQGESLTSKTFNDIKLQGDELLKKEIASAREQTTHNIQLITKEVEQHMEQLLIKKVQEIAHNILKQLFDSEQQKLDYRLNQIHHFPQQLITISQIAKLPITSQYTHELTAFSGSELFKKTDEPYLIVGGCALYAPNINTTPILQGERFAQALQEAFLDLTSEHGEFSYGDKTYIAYKQVISDFQFLPGQANNELQIMHALSQLNQNPNLIKRLNPAALRQPFNAENLTLTHYAATLFSSECFKELIQHGGKELLSLTDSNGHLPLHMAAQAGNEETVAILVAQAPQLVDAKNTRDLTPLMLAIQYGHLKTVEILHRAGANFNHCLPNGLFPLYLAAQRNFSTLAQWIIHNVSPIDLNKTLDNQMSLLHLAIDTEQLELAGALIKHKALCTTPRKADGFTPLHCAAQQGHVSILALMRTMHPDLILDLALESKKTPLHLAAEAGKLAMVQFLIENGACMNAQNLQQETPLMRAIQGGHVEVACYLANKTTINLTNKHQQTASNLALQYGMPLVADCLIQRGEDIYLRDDKGFSALYFLVRNGEHQRLKCLARTGIIFKAKFHGNSLTAIAAQHGHFMTVDFLMDLGIAFESSTALSLLEYAIMADEISFLHEAEHFSSKDLLLLAIKANAISCFNYLWSKISEQDKQAPPLMLAAIESNQEKIFSILIKVCSDVNQRIDSLGNTFGHFAVSKGAHKILNSLKEAGFIFSQKNNLNQSVFHLAILQEDANLLKQLLRLSPDTHWPQDLWNLEMPIENKEISKILTKFKPTFTLQCPSQEISTTSNPQPILAPAFELTEEENLIKRKFTTYLTHSQFEKALRLLQKEAVLLRLFTTHAGGELLQNLFNQIKEIYFLDSDEQNTTNIPIEPSLKSLLEALQENAINPALYRGAHNLLLTVFKTHSEEIAHYRFNLLRHFFPESVLTLMQDEQVNTLCNFMKMALKKSYFQLFDTITALLESMDTPPFNPLHEAIHANQFDLVKKLLKNYPVNATNKKGQSALMFAAANGNLSLVNLLLTAGADVNQVDLYGNNVLFFALEKPSEAVALTLIPLMKKPNQANRFGLTPLMRAATQDVISILRFLGETVGLATLQTVDKKGLNALHYAALQGKLRSIRYLVEKGFSIDAAALPDKSKALEKTLGQTALHLAARGGHAKATLLLLELGANPELEDKRGFSFIEYAVCSNDKRTLDLVKLGAMYHRKEKEFTLLKAAVLYNNIQVLSELILAKTNLNGLDKEGRSALHFACIQGSGDAAQLLLEEQEVLLEGIDQFGYTPMHYAARFGHVKLIDLLINAGATIDLSMHQKTNALELACAHNQLGAALALLKHGATLSIVNSEGLTPAQVALLNNHFGLVEQLRQLGDKSIHTNAFTALTTDKKQSLETALALFKKQYPNQPSSTALSRFGFYSFKPQDDTPRAVASLSLSN